MAEWRTLCSTGHRLCSGKSLRQTKEKNGKCHRMARVKMLSLRTEKQYFANQIIWIPDYTEGGFMKKFYLKLDILNMLSDEKRRKTFGTEEESMLKDAFIDAGIIDKETLEMDAMAEELLNAYLMSENRVILHFHEEKEYVIHGFYFVDDLITMVSAYKEGGEFLWLPTGNYIIGVFADLLKDIEIKEKQEEFTGDFSEYCTEDNYKEILPQQITETLYKDILLSSSGKNELWMKGHGSSKEDQFFIYVVFKDQKAYYYRQENMQFTYGCADEIQLIQILSGWMLKKHRELILGRDVVKKVGG